MAEVYENRTSAQTNGKTALGPESGAESGALGAHLPLLDADLQAMIDAWPMLSAGVKQRIVLAIQDGE